jgi:IS5 family transposase
MNKGASLELLSRRQYRNLLVASEIYRQQQWMWSNNQKRIEHRIVSLTQPHIRPIVRGKSGSPTEFGAKLSVSCVEGYVFLEKISSLNYNESGDFISQVEAYQAQEDERIRNEIEGKFGQGKRRFSLNRVMAKLSNTSETSITLTFLVINLVKLLRQFYCLFLCQFFPNIMILSRRINFSYELNNRSKAGLIM